MPSWNGALLWRGLAEVPPVLDGRTMVWAGPPAAEVRRLPGRRPARRPAAVQLHRRAAHRRSWSRRARGLEPARTARRLHRTVRDAGSSPGSTCPRSIRSSAGHVPLPDGRSRPGRPVVVRPHHAARRRGPPDVPDRIERRVAGHPRCPRADRLPALPPATTPMHALAATTRSGAPPPPRSCWPIAGWGPSCRCSWSRSGRPMASPTSPT